MDVETLREYCLSLPQTSEDMPFAKLGSEVLAFRVCGKIFAMIDLDDLKWFALKCDPELALDLRSKHIEISEGWHMNKKYWNQVDLFGSLSNDFICSLIRHSYSEVVKKLPKKEHISNPEICQIK